MVFNMPLMGESGGRPYLNADIPTSTELRVGYEPQVSGNDLQGSTLQIGEALGYEKAREMAKTFGGMRGEYSDSL